MAEPRRVGSDFWAQDPGSQDEPRRVGDEFWAETKPLLAADIIDIDDELVRRRRAFDQQAVDDLDNPDFNLQNEDTGAVNARGKLGVPTPRQAQPFPKWLTAHQVDPEGEERERLAKMAMDLVTQAPTHNETISDLYNVRDEHRQAFLQMVYQTAKKHGTRRSGGTLGNAADTMTLGLLPDSMQRFLNKAPREVGRAANDTVASMAQFGAEIADWIESSDGVGPEITSFDQAVRGAFEGGDDPTENEPWYVKWPLQALPSITQMGIDLALTAPLAPVGGSSRALGRGVKGIFKADDAYRAANAIYWTGVMSPGVIKDLRAKGVDNATAVKAGATIGFLQGLVETLEINPMAKSNKTARGIQENVVDFAKRYGKEIGVEEFTQAAIEETGKNLLLTGDLEIDRVIRKAGKQTLEGAGPGLFIVGAGAPISIPKAIGQSVIDNPRVQAATREWMKAHEFNYPMLEKMRKQALSRIEVKDMVDEGILTPEWSDSSLRDREQLRKLFDESLKPENLPIEPFDRIEQLRRGNQDVVPETQSNLDPTVFGRGRNRRNGRRVFPGSGQTTAGTERVKAQADAYIDRRAEELGLERPDPEAEPAEVDAKRSRVIGEDYETAPDNSLSDPAVRAAYEAMAQETLDQWNYMVKELGISVDFVDQAGEYADSSDLVLDTTTYGHMSVLKTDKDTFGPEGVEYQDHPLLREVPNNPGILFNDIFRAVHDYFGHVSEHNQFGQIGEERAWTKHSQMYSPTARQAMTMETRGQNSWVNHGPHMYDDIGWRGSKDHPNYVKPQDRPFARQKVGIMPADVTHGDIMPEPPPVAPPTAEGAAEQMLIDQLTKQLKDPEKVTDSINIARNTARLAGKTLDQWLREEKGFQVVTDADTASDTAAGEGRLSQVAEAPTARITNETRARFDAISDIKAEDRTDEQKTERKALSKQIRESADRRFERTKRPSVDDTIGLFSGEMPRYLKKVQRFMKRQKARLLNGDMTVRDTAKAVIMTIASQGADAMFVSSIREKLGHDKDAPYFRLNAGEVAPFVKFMDSRKAKKFGHFFTDTNKDGEVTIRPEEVAAAWLLSPAGKKALDNLEAGKYNEADWNELRAIRKAFGDDRFKGSGIFGHKGENKIQMKELMEMTAVVNASKGDIPALTANLADVYGIGPAKLPFVKHLLGIGDATTVDAVQLNYWMTGKGDTKHLKGRIGQLVQDMRRVGRMSAKSPLGKYTKKMNEDLLAELHKRGHDIDLHILHHWLWDILKGKETTHAGMMHAQRFAQENAEKVEKGAVEFMQDGRTIMYLFENADFSTFVHEMTHIARRYLSAEDLAAAEKFAGVEDGNWTPEAEEKFARGMEAFLREGHAPKDPQLAGAFERMHKWMKDIYKTVKGSSVHIHIPSRMAEVYEKILGSGPAPIGQVMGVKKNIPEFEAAFRAEQSMFGNDPSPPDPRRGETPPPGEVPTPSGVRTRSNNPGLDSFLTDMGFPNERSGEEGPPKNPDGSPMTLYIPDEGDSPPPPTGGESVMPNSDRLRTAADRKNMDIVREATEQLAPIPSRERQARQEVMLEAMRQGLHEQQAANINATRAITDPVSIKDPDTVRMGMIIAYHEARKRLQELKVAARQAPDAAAIKENTEQQRRVLNEMDTLTRGIFAIGSHAGRLLRGTRDILIDKGEGYGFDDMTSMATVLKKEPLTEKELKEFDEFAEEFDSMTKRLAELEQTVKHQRAELALKKTASGRKKRKKEEVKKELSDLYDDANELFNGGCV